MKYNKNEKTFKKLSGMIILIVAVAALLFVSFVVSLSEFSDDGETSDDVASASEEAVSTTDTSDVSVPEQSNTIDKQYKYYDDITFEQCAFGNDLVYSGDLAVVTGENGKYPVIPEEDPLVNVYSKKTGGYGLSGTALVLRNNAMTNIDRFIMSFYSVFARNGLGIDKAYVSSESVSSGPLMDLASGNSVKFAIYNSGASFADKDFSYLKEQAFRYGVIQRFPDGKMVNTGVEADNSIYRYVGVAHSCYMNHYNLCLEEYIDKLRTEKIIEFDNEYEENASYIMCYIEKDASSDITYIPVPSDEKYEYGVSGDGSGGFIVTIKIA